MGKKITLVVLASMFFILLIIPGSQLSGVGGFDLRLNGVWMYSVCIAPIPYGDCFVIIKI